MEQSILTSTKQILGLNPDHDEFDLDVLTCINAAFAVLNDLGVGPVDGVVVEDDSLTWAEFGETPTQLSQLKQFTFLHVRRAFDPPQTGPLTDVITKQIEEAVWRLEARRLEPQ